MRQKLVHGNAQLEPSTKLAVEPFGGYSVITTQQAKQADCTRLRSAWRICKTRAKEFLIDSLCEELVSHGIRAIAKALK
eukprot:scaffold81484_cov31-Tisochrysis_lutea.AAC.10